MTARTISKIKEELIFVLIAGVLGLSIWTTLWFVLDTNDKVSYMYDKMKEQ